MMKQIRVSGSKEEMGINYLLVEGHSAANDKLVVKRWFEYDLALKLLNDDPEVESQKLQTDSNASVNGSPVAENGEKTAYKSADEVHEDDDGESPFSGGGVFLM
jgi:hypothetical protein